MLMLQMRLITILHVAIKVTSVKRNNLTVIQQPPSGRLFSFQATHLQPSLSRGILKDMHILIVLMAVVLGAVVSFGVMNTRSVDTAEDVSTKEEVEKQEDEVVTPIDRISDARDAVTIGSTQNLSSRGLTRVPEDVFMRDNTTVLDLSGNSLSGHFLQKSDTYKSYVCSTYQITISPECLRKWGSFLSWKYLIFPIIQ